MNRESAVARKPPWPALVAAISSAASSAAVQAYLLNSAFTPVALLVVAAFIYAESRQKSRASRWLRRHYMVVSGVLLGALTGVFIAPLITPSFTMTPFHYVLAGVCAALWLAIAFGILSRPGDPDEDPRP
jgi:hypothetical protein